MAKVKDQIYDGSEETYTDASGVIHFFGELIRHIMTDAYPLPSLNPTGVIRKSPRGYRPSQQGPGSAEQLPWRMCFQQCTDRWNEMPEECPDPAPCLLVSSKAQVWDGKISQGVMCSYIDLFMGCCMSSCTEISITGPDGKTFTGGTISTSNNCWPCESPCKESTLSIEYTTDVMAPGESQALSVLDSVFGNTVPCCENEDIEWKIVSGEGSLSPETGPVTTYTAPAEIVGCSASPVIELSDCCDRSATIQLYITHQDAPTPAYSVGDGICLQLCLDGWPGCSGWCGYMRKTYDCFGEYMPGYDQWMTFPPGTDPISAAVGTCASICQGRINNWCAANFYMNDYLDLRSEEQILQGCCPPPPA